MVVVPVINSTAVVAVLLGGGNVGAGFELLHPDARARRRPAVTLLTRARAEPGLPQAQGEEEARAAYPYRP